MKKTLTFLLFSFSFFVSTMIGSAKVEVIGESLQNEYDLFGLGKAVNVAKDTYLDDINIRMSENIFDTEWLNEKLVTTNIIAEKLIQYSKPDVSSGTSMEEMTANFNANFRFGTSSGVNIENLFKRSTKSEFDFGYENLFESYEHRFFYNYYGYYPYYLGEINDSGILSENLDQTYEGYLNLLFKGAITPKIFFDKFGTHVITSGLYGGRLDYKFFALNNQKEISNDMKISAKDCITEQLTSIINGGSTFSYDFGTSVGYKQMNEFQEGRLRTIGGCMIGVGSFNNFDRQFNNWLESLSVESSVLISIPEEGLVPLWNLLPSQHKDQKAWFKEVCEDYITDYCNDLDFEFPPANVGDTYTDGEFHDIRVTQKPIRIDNENYNFVDAMDLNYLCSFDYDYNYFVNKKYNKIKIEIQMELKEENHGYQYIYLYKKGKKSSKFKISEIKYELGRNVIIDDYTLKTFIFDNVDINSLIDGKFYIKYGSDGILDNDWWCRNIKVKITYYKSKENI